MTREEKKKIEKMVYTRFPIIKSERKCRTEKRERDRARESYRKKLMEGYRPTKKEYES